MRTKEGQDGGANGGAKRGPNRGDENSEGNQAGKHAREEDGRRLGGEAVTRARAGDEGHSSHQCERCAACEQGQEAMAAIGKVDGALPAQKGHGDQMPWRGMRRRGAVAVGRQGTGSRRK